MSDNQSLDPTAPWSEEAFRQLEEDHPRGMTVQQILQAFAARGDKLSEASFRKYVQLGLLPRSVRVGRKGKNRGSQGLYPSTVARQIELIRRLMSQGYTIEEIRREFLFLGSDIEELARQLTRVLGDIDRAVMRGSEARAVDEVLDRALGEARTMADELIDKLRGIEQRLSLRARMARAAV